MLEEQEAVKGAVACPHETPSAGNKLGTTRQPPPLPSILEVHPLHERHFVMKTQGFVPLKRLYSLYGGYNVLWLVFLLHFKFFRAWECLHL